SPRRAPRRRRLGDEAARDGEALGEERLAVPGELLGHGGERVVRAEDERARRRGGEALARALGEEEAPDEASCRSELGRRAGERALRRPRETVEALARVLE